LRSSQPSSIRRRRRRKTEPAVTAAVAETPPPWQQLYVLGRPKPCKFDGIIEGCFGTFPITNGMRETCDNPACKKELRAQTHRPAVRKYDAANRPSINARRKKNYPVKKGRINELRRASTAANRKLKPCKITTISDADLPTDGLRATFAKARKTCLGTFYPKGKQQTCSTPCSDALEKLGQYKRQRKWNGKNKAKINAAKKHRRARREGAGLPYQ
jgi:hypothetical protein